MKSFEHITVLRDELLDSLSLHSGDCAIDCTAGGGGHTQGLLERVGKAGKVLAFDRDSWAMDVLRARFPSEIASGQLELIQRPFSSIVDELEQRGLCGQVHGICADIGVSSPQLDEADRGFSFAKDGPLDMRMDQSQELTAATIVNSWAERDLTRLFRNYGEDPQAKQIARAIVRRREKLVFTSTLDLAQVVASAVHYKERSRKHPATKTFQALRIEVNGELEELDCLLKSVPKTLRPGGRCAIISFHSLEDRLIKLAFRDFAEGAVRKMDRKLPLTGAQLDELRTYAIIKPFPLGPSEDELKRNPRSRSAKLRVLERKPGGTS